MILEEIAMHEDDPTDMVHDQFAQVLFGDGPLAGRCSAPSSRSSRSAAARSPATTGAATGRRTWSSRSPATSTTPPSSGWCARRSARPGMLDGDAEPAAPARRAPGRATASAACASSGVPPSRPTSCSATPGVARTDERRFALGVLNAALGGGMSSRLFQEVREKRGLAYSVYSYHAQYADTGLFGVYAGCVPRKVDEVLAICRDEIAKVAATGHHRRGARARQGPAARARWSSAWRTPARG